MWSKFIHFEVIVICFLSLIPWPGPSVFKISCSRESARVVRKIVHAKWLPILDKYRVQLPLECPFHPQRDIFGPQQVAKVQNRPSQWTCGFCGKSFYEEPHLDQHFEQRHAAHINMAEDAVCLADYCDIMRCKVLVAKDSSLADGSNGASTDVEIWREASAYRTALQPTGPRDLARLPFGHANSAKKSTDHPSSGQSSMRSEAHAQKSSSSSTSKGSQLHCDKQQKPAASDQESRTSSSRPPADEEEEDDDDEDDDEDDEDDDDATGRTKRSTKSRKDNKNADAEANATTSTPRAGGSSNSGSACDDEHLVDSTRPPIDHKEQRILEMQRAKANCRTDDLERLKTRCEIMTRNCVVGLLGQMADEEFYKMEDELNKAVCWYLTCDRYWEDGPMEQRPFPWGLVFVLVMVLSLGVCFCYYIIWILFDTDDHQHGGLGGPGFGSPSHYGQPHYMYEPHQHQQQQHLQQHHLHPGQQHPTYALHSSPTHHQYLHSNAMVASSIGGYAPTLQQQQQQQHHLHQHQHLHQQQHSAHSTHLGPHGPSGLSISSHPPPSLAQSTPPMMPLPTTSVGGLSHGQSSGVTAATAAAAAAGMATLGAAAVGAAAAAGAGSVGGAAAFAGAEEFYVAPEFQQELTGQSEHYIYVTYPPELKRRLLERYGREIYWLLLRKDLYD